MKAQVTTFYKHIVLNLTFSGRFDELWYRIKSESILDYFDGENLAEILKIYDDYLLTLESELVPGKAKPAVIEKIKTRLLHAQPGYPPESLKVLPATIKKSLLENQPLVIYAAYPMAFSARPDGGAQITADDFFAAYLDALTSLPNTEAIRRHAYQTGLQEKLDSGLIYARHLMDAIFLAPGARRLLGPPAPARIVENETLQPRSGENYPNETKNTDTSESSMQHKFVVQISRHIAREEYKRALELLKNRHSTSRLADLEKRVLIHIFDRFLADLEEAGRYFNEEEIKELAEFKRYLILYQLETSNYSRERLKELIRSTLMQSKPLADLISRPFAFYMDGKQIPADQALAVYREILEQTDAVTTRKILNKQRLYYQNIPPKKFSVLYPLAGFVSNMVRQTSDL